MEQQSSENPQVPQQPVIEPTAGPQPKKHANTKRLLLIAIALLLIVGGGIIALAMNKSDKKDGPSKADIAQNQTNDDNTFATQYLQNCKERTVSFTKPPIAFDKMGYLEPMGKMSDGHVTPTDHVYVAPLSMRASDNTTDVVMPADGTVTAISAMPSQYIGDRADQKTASEDHRLIITHNCQYVSIFIHVHALSDALNKALGQPLAPNTSKQVSIELKAGDKLGSIGGNPVDWSLMDAKHKLSGFVTPSLYSGEPWKIHVIDPTSVYSGDVKQQFTQKSLRSTEPYGGKIDYDKKGALIGNWFQDGTNGYSGKATQHGSSRYWDGHLAIVPDYIDPTATVVSMGNWQGKAGQYIARNATDPTGITAKTGPVKYELVQTAYTKADGQHWSPDTLPGKGLRVNTANMPLVGTVLVEVQANEKLKIEHFPGKSAAQVSGFTDKALSYYR